jgi:hypothetical protein
VFAEPAEWYALYCAGADTGANTGANASSRTEHWPTLTAKFWAILAFVV